MKYRNTWAAWIIVGILGLAAASAPAGGSSPKRVLIIGDSMMRISAHCLELELSKQPDVKTLAYTSLGSGLARLDMFDWMAKIDALKAEFDPDATIVWFGANDRQPMRTTDGVIRPGAPEWDAEYAGRVGKAMDALTAREGTRVLWLELPVMREPSIQADVDAINQLVAGEAGKRPQVSYVATRPLLGRDPATFSLFIKGPDFMPLQVRDNDGVHLTRAGAEIITAQILQMLYGDTPAKETP